MKCFFCDVQTNTDDKKILEGNSFFARFDDFPVSPGHVEVISKDHIESFFDVTPEQVQEIYTLLTESKKIIDQKLHPDGYNVGLNNGSAAGQTIPHFHIHLIPRYVGDVPNPKGGVRNIIPEAGDYTEKAKEIGRDGYVSQ